MIKTCPVCQIKFSTTSSKRKTCGKSCSYRLMVINQDKTRYRKTYNFICAVCQKPFSITGSRGHNSLVKTCSEACYIELARQHAKEQDLSPMLAGRDVPHMKSTPEHYNAREWRLRSPDGAVFVFKNLNHFIRTHKEYFDGYLEEKNHTPKAAYSLSNLAPWRRSIKRPCLSWHGWTWAD